jgi:transcriptional regulator with GAF, ATPase, and Fis domain
MSVEIVSLVSSPESYVYNLKEIGRKAAETAEREHIKNTLSYTNWNRKAAARLLQVSYKALLYKIERYHLNGLPSQKDGE